MTDITPIIDLIAKKNDEIERLRKALRDVMDASNCPYEVARNALENTSGIRNSE